MFQLNSRNFHPSYNAQSEYSCETSGCDEEGICRCGRIVDVDFPTDLASINVFFEGFYTGSGGLEKVLAHWFVRKHYKDLEWGWEASGGYYGDEMGNTYVREDNDFFNKARSFEKMTNHERICFLLETEYGRVLPKLKEPREWELRTVFLSDVVSSLNTELNPRMSSEYEAFCARLVDSWDVKYRTEFQTYTQILAPLTVKNGNGKFQIIDGRHRAAALTKEYDYHVSEEVVDKKGRKKQTTVKKVFAPVFMWIICPTEKDDGK